MAALVRGIFMMKKSTPVREKIMVVEKRNLLTSGALSAGANIVKVGSGLTALTYIGSEAQQLKGNLMKELFNGSNSLDNLGNNLGEKFNSVKNDLISGIAIIGAFSILGLIIYQSS